MSIPEVADVPLWWLDRAGIALEAEYEASKQRERHGQTQDAIAQIHGGR